MAQTVKEIHDEYYSQYRGQGTNLPSWSGSSRREYLIGINLLRAAIKKWERADGILWSALKTTLADAVAEGAAVTPTPVVIENTYTGSNIAAPSNMRKPPAFVRFTNANGVKDVPVLDPLKINAASNGVFFVGSPNTGFTMVVGSEIAAEYNGASFDYIYYRQARLPSLTDDPSDMYIDMSDPSFAVQYMLAGRFVNSRNGFGFKSATKEADLALANMKIEEYSGQPGSTEAVTPDVGWGVPAHTQNQFGSMEL